ncbi:hypothetical protein Golax_003138 [Gossypium laxum]|uniref:Oxysterol-binding protein n=1 Tax=Gossypium laxum TaxID=34288 RepID=A0A7J9AEF0_9ROSI|nr:hypothetical protein [Gossypium laxum]
MIRGPPLCNCSYFIVFIELLLTLSFFFCLCSKFYSEGSVTDTDEDNERVDAAEEETDEDEHNFFDTRDFLSSSSFKSNGSDFRTSSFSSDDGLNGFDSEDDIDPYIKSVGSNFPYIKRRKKLPDPVEREKGVSLWSMIKDNIGKDLTKVCLPVYFNEPLSSLQKCFEDLEYSYLLDRAYEWGKSGNNLMRILNVAAFAVSGYSSTEGRICKPFNPLLGETYEADFPDKGLRFFSEKILFVSVLMLYLKLMRAIPYLVSGQSSSYDCSMPLSGYRMEIVG